MADIAPMICCVAGCDQDPVAEFAGTVSLPDPGVSMEDDLSTWVTYSLYGRWCAFHWENIPSGGVPYDMARERLTLVPWPTP